MTQHQMQQNADARLLSVCKAFSDIQSSGNPLTPEEVDRLIAKRPEAYGVLAAWGTRKRKTGT